MNERILLGGGCFWCIEAVYQQVPGVVSLVSGYAGGPTSNPSYEQVCTGRTGHAEVVEVTFDNLKVTLEQILDIFWKAHDPTTLNRQGADVGTQYRSALYWTDPSQVSVIEQSMKQAEQDWKKPLTTEVAQSPTFWKAEGYHQNYYRNNPGQGYCRAVISPKLKKLGLSFLS